MGEKTHHKHRMTTTISAAAIALTATVGITSPAVASDPANPQSTVAVQNTKAHAQSRETAAGVNPFRGRFLYDHVRMRKGPNTHYYAKGMAYRGQTWHAPTNITRGNGQKIRCPRSHNMFRWSDSWKLVRNGATNVTGWVNTCFLF